MKPTTIKPTMQIKVPPPAESRVVLELSMDEAVALYDVLRHVGGDPYLSRRKHMDPILAIMADGFHPESPWRMNNKPFSEDVTGTVYFTPAKAVKSND